MYIAPAVQYSPNKLSNSKQTNKTKQMQQTNMTSFFPMCSFVNDADYEDKSWPIFIMFTLFFILPISKIQVLFLILTHFQNFENVSTF